MKDTSGSFPNGTQTNELFDLIAYKLASEAVGVYPAAVHGGDKPYDRRTDYMEGWNACIYEIFEVQESISLWFRTLPAEAQPEIQAWLEEDRLSISVRGKQVRMYVNCNDLFHWACADGEEITADDLPDFRKAIELSPTLGDQLWCCRKRRMRPQKPFLRTLNEDLVVLFEAAGPERTDG